MELLLDEYLMELFLEESLRDYLMYLLEKCLNKLPLHGQKEFVLEVSAKEILKKYPKKKSWNGLLNSMIKSRL